MRLKANEAERLRGLIRGMSRNSAIYELLKEELSVLGYWKAKPRGKPNYALASSRYSVSGGTTTIANHNILRYASEE